MNTNNTETLIHVSIFRDGGFEGVEEMTKDQIDQRVKLERHEGANCEYFEPINVIGIMGAEVRP